MSNKWCSYCLNKVHVDTLQISIGCILPRTCLPGAAENLDLVGVRRSAYADSPPCFAGTWRCGKCSSKGTMLRRIYHQWPTQEFMQLSEDPHITSNRVDTHQKTIAMRSFLHIESVASSLIAPATPSLLAPATSSLLVPATSSLLASATSSLLGPATSSTPAPQHG